MSTETARETESARPRWQALDPWIGGVLAGLLGGLLFGILMSVMTPGVIENAIPALYGFGPDAGLIGWIIHMSNAAILGVVFAALVERTSLSEMLTDNFRTGIAGLVYGVGIWIVFAGIVMPLWLGAVNFGGAPGVPNLQVSSLIGHIVYGVVLGIAFSVLVEFEY